MKNFRKMMDKADPSKVTKYGNRIDVPGRHIFVAESAELFDSQQDSTEYFRINGEVVASDNPEIKLQDYTILFNLSKRFGSEYPDRNRVASFMEACGYTGDERGELYDQLETDPLAIQGAVCAVKAKQSEKLDEKTDVTKVYTNLFYEPLEEAEILELQESA